MKYLSPSRFIRPLVLWPAFAVAILAVGIASAKAESSALLSIQGQGMAPNQVVTLSTGPKQKLQSTVSPNGTVAFNNLKYAPNTNLVFSLSYSVGSAGVKTIPNTILMELDPFTGTVGMKGNASRAASIIVNVSAEDSHAMIANQNGYFAGSADSISGFSKGNLRVVASIINVEESCCPKTMKPYAPVSISIISQPVKKASADLIEATTTAKLEISLPEYSYGVSVPDEMIDGTWVLGIQKFTNQITKSIMAQTTALGSFLQAQNNSAGLLSLQKKHAQSAKDGILSEQLCRYGSLAQGVAASEALSSANKLSLMSALQANEMGQANTIRSGKNPSQRLIDKYKATNCDKRDANEAIKCKSTASDKRFNMDIDYASAIDTPLTLDVDFVDGASLPQEEDIFSMAENLFPSRPIMSSPESEGYNENNSEFRSIQAIRTVAKNSFVSQVAEKVKGTAGSVEFIKKLMLALGISEDQTKLIIGDKPSYYAQMEVLTKKIFQDPVFYVNLMESPANVLRQQTAIRAIKLQQQNDLAQVVKRREMLLAVLLEMKLRERSKMVDQRINPTTDKPK